jgi:hypothetical protein
MGAISFGDISCGCTQVAVMDIRAIVLVGGAAGDGAAAAESIGGVPLGDLDVLGLPVLERVLQRLRGFGISSIAVIRDSPEPVGLMQQPISFPPVRQLQAPGEQFWQAAEDTFLKCAEGGADLVVTLRVGPYVEVDYETLIQHHLDHHCAVTMAVDREGLGLDLCVLNACARRDATALFQSRLQRLRRECEGFRVAGYVNRLRNAAGLRQLAVHGLLGCNAIRPEGFQLKPGVWVSRSARIHPRARVIAPAFVGANARIRASALITRGSVIEHHAEVDCGTVVEDSTVLPFTCVGAGLDVMHSVVGFRRLTHLMRNAEVEISDATLVGMAPISAVSRLAGSTAALFAFLPKQIYRGLFATSHRKSAADASEFLKQPGAALETSALEAPATGPEGPEFPKLAVARRYGDQ